MTAYRAELFLGDLAWEDVSVLTRDPRTRSIADQLYRAVCGISPTIAEGYSRGTGKDRARFYEYALGSVRESRDWYFKSRFILGDELVQHRLSVLNHLTRLLLTMIPQQRGTMVREEVAEYIARPESIDDDLIALLNSSPRAYSE